MIRLSGKLDEWARHGPPADTDDRAEISLVMATGDVAAAEAEIQAAAGSHALHLEPSFRGEIAAETDHRFQILVLPSLKVSGAETLAFEVARELMILSTIKSARPVLVDSLIGEAMVAREEGLEFLGLGCSSDDAGPEARGWAPRGLGVLKAWQTTRGEGVTVASIDTGHSSHEQLREVIATDRPHLNLVEGGSDAHDRFSTNLPLENPGHGTLVASVVASRGQIDADGTTGDDLEIVGSAPEAKVLPIRAIRSVVDLRQSRIPAAIEHAIAQDCDVIIMALGSAFPIEPVEVALRAATRKGVVVVCAAGNCVGLVVFPARFAPQGLCTAVAAVDYLYSPWEKTSKGDAVTISAFGESVWGASKTSAAGSDTLIKPSQGTTLASSLTAGIAALWLSANGGRARVKAHADASGVTVQKLFNDLVTATAYRPPSGWPRGMGAGLVNAARLVSAPLPAPMESIVDVEMPIAHVTPLKRMLSVTAAEIDPIAGLEAAALPEDLAAETLWRLYQTTARKRAAASFTAVEGLELPAPAAAGRETPELAGSLAVRPWLRALTQ